MNELVIESKFKMIGEKIEKIENALASSIEDCEEEEITKAEYDMVESFQSISDCYIAALESFKLFIREANENKVPLNQIEGIEGVTLGLDMIDFTMTKLAKNLEISI